MRVRISPYSQLALAVMLAWAAASAAFAGDWPTFSGSAQRLGYVSDETLLSPSTVPALQLHWQAKLPTASGLQPVLLSNVAMASGTHDDIYVATLGGYVLALNARNGAVDWQNWLGRFPYSCYGAMKRGISSTPTIDRTAGLIYVVTQDGQLHALSIFTGVEQAGFPLPVIDSANVAAGTYNHSSPTQIGSMLYITTGMSCEGHPTAPFHGQIIQVDLTVPQVVNRFFPVGDGSVNGGGIWGPGGVTAEWDGSALYGATANAIPGPSKQALGEHVISLDPNLNLLAANLPPLPRVADLDFGATPVLVDASGCAPMLAAMNKSGTLFLYDRAAIGNGPVQTLTISTGSGNSDFIGSPAYDPALQMLFVANPVASLDGSYPHGLVALRVGAGCTLTTAWAQLAGNGLESFQNTSKTPVVANGVVWMSTGTGLQLGAFNEQDGTPLWSSSLLAGGVTGPPMVANGQVFVASGTVLYAFGL